MAVSGMARYQQGPGDRDPLRGGSALRQPATRDNSSRPSPTPGPSGSPATKPLASGQRPVAQRIDQALSWACRGRLGAAGPTRNPLFPGGLVVRLAAAKQGARLGRHRPRSVGARAQKSSNEIGALPSQKHKIDVNALLNKTIVIGTLIANNGPKFWLQCTAAQPDPLA